MASSLTRGIIDEKHYCRVQLSYQVKPRTERIELVVLKEMRTLVNDEMISGI